MPEYTPSQLKAIETKGKSLVVSAGAGSGKTTVLTERIIRGIIDGGDIDDGGNTYIDTTPSRYEGKAVYSPVICGG